MRSLSASCNDVSFTDGNSGGKAELIYEEEINNARRNNETTDNTNALLNLLVKKVLDNLRMGESLLQNGYIKSEVFKIVEAQHSILNDLNVIKKQINSLTSFQQSSENEMTRLKQELDLLKEEIIKIRIQNEQCFFSSCSRAVSSFCTPTIVASSSLNIANNNNTCNLSFFDSSNSSSVVPLSSSSSFSSCYPANCSILKSANTLNYNSNHLSINNIHSIDKYSKGNFASCSSHNLSISCINIKDNAKNNNKANNNNMLSYAFSHSTAASSCTNENQFFSCNNMSSSLFSSSSSRYNIVSSSAVKNKKDIFCSELIGDNQYHLLANKKDENKEKQSNLCNCKTFVNETNTFRKQGKTEEEKQYIKTDNEVLQSKISASDTNQLFNFNTYDKLYGIGMRDRAKSDDIGCAHRDVFNEKSIHLFNSSSYFLFSSTSEIINNRISSLDNSMQRREFKLNIIDEIVEDRSPSQPLYHIEWRIGNISKIFQRMDLLDCFVSPRFETNSKSLRDVYLMITFNKSMNKSCIQWHCIKLGVFFSATTAATITYRLSAGNVNSSSEKKIHNFSEVAWSGCDEFANLADVVDKNKDNLLISVDIYDIVPCSELMQRFCSISASSASATSNENKQVEGVSSCNCMNVSPVVYSENENSNIFPLFLSKQVENSHHSNKHNFTYASRNNNNNNNNSGNMNKDEFSTISSSSSSSFFFASPSDTAINTSSVLSRSNNINLLDLSGDNMYYCVDAMKASTRKLATDCLSSLPSVILSEKRAPYSVSLQNYYDNEKHNSRERISSVGACSDVNVRKESNFANRNERKNIKSRNINNGIYNNVLTNLNNSNFNFVSDSNNFNKSETQKESPNKHLRVDWIDDLLSEDGRRLQKNNDSYNNFLSNHIQTSSSSSVSKPMVNVDKDKVLDEEKVSSIKSVLYSGEDFMTILKAIAEFKIPIDLQHVMISEIVARGCLINDSKNRMQFFSVTAAVCAANIFHKTVLFQGLKKFFAEKMDEVTAMIPNVKNILLNELLPILREDESATLSAEQLEFVVEAIQNNSHRISMMERRDITFSL